jgi:hypothetical protein
MPGGRIAIQVFERDTYKDIEWGLFHTLVPFSVYAANADITNRLAAGWTRLP